MEKIEEICNTISESYLNKAGINYKERIYYLKKLEMVILDQKVNIQNALFQDLRKSSFETDATEIFTVLTEIRHCLRNLHHWVRHTAVLTPIPMIGTSSYIIPEPKGMVLIIAPWNYPFNLCISPLLSAIAAGNRVLIKPSEFCPHTAEILKKIVDVVFPKDVVAVINGDYSVAEALVKLPFHHIFYTGSSRVGKLIMAAAAENLTSITLELGGKSPCIIDDSFSIQLAAERIAFAKFINAGQTCIAPDFVLLPKAKIKQFIDCFNTVVDKMLGESKLQSKEYTGIINSKHFNRLHTLWSAACESEGYDYTLDSDASSLKIKPTCIQIEKWSNPIMNEEIFGPILPVIGYEDLQASIAVLNQFHRPLNLYIFSNNDSMINHILKQTRSGGVTINECLLNYCNNNLPFGGDGNSGLGKTHGKFGFDTFSHFRAVTKQSKLPSGLLFFYPPYTPLKNKIKDLLVKYF